MSRITNEEPIAPSERVNVPRDLETICLKCLRKDSADRYPSAQELAEDIGRYHNGESISARSMSSLEKSFRWVKKNRTIAGLMAAVTLSLIMGVSVSLWEMVRANQNAAKALLEAARADAKTDEAEANLRLANDQTKLVQEKAEAEKKAREETERTQDTLINATRDLALSRFDENKVREARRLLRSIPERGRGWEWRFLQRHFEGSYATLYGHTHWVTTVAWSPDGSRIASGSDDKTLRVWGTKRGTILLELQGHTSSVTSVAWSPDGGRLISEDKDHSIRVWDARNGTEVEQLQALPEWAKRSSLGGISPNGRWIAIPEGDEIEIHSLEISAQELVSRRAKARPDPLWHREQMEKAKESDDPFAAAVQHSLLERANGRLAMEKNSWDQAYAHFIAAALLKPKPTVPDIVPKK